MYFVIITNSFQKMHKTHYPTNLIEKQWQIIEKTVNSRSLKTLALLNWYI